MELSLLSDESSEDENVALKAGSCSESSDEDTETDADSSDEGTDDTLAASEDNNHHDLMNAYDEDNVQTSHSTVLNAPPKHLPAPDFQFHPFGDHTYASHHSRPRHFASVRADHSTAQVPPDSAEMRAVVTEALRKPPTEVIVQVNGLNVTRQDLETVVGLSWLNDVVVNVYLSLIVSRSQRNASLPKVYAFSTFFYVLYRRLGYGSVCRWTRMENIFAYDILLVPIHMNDNHWTLAVVDFRDKKIGYMDSMGGRNKDCLEALLNYLAQELADKKHCSLNRDEWRLENVHNLPQQKNRSDCGIFALKFADYASQDAVTNFNQTDMPNFRERMMYEIIRSAIIPKHNCRRQG